MAVLAEQFDYILVEADGAARRPLKAHAPHEPVIPTEANQTICVVGASGFGRPIAAAAHRPERYALLAGVPEATEATPEAEARVLRSEDLHTKVYVNQVETLWNLADARGSGAPDGLSGSGRQSVEEGVFSMLVIIRGAGDLATGIALRLKRAHISVIMTDIPAPTAIRRTVAFSQAIVLGETKVEDVTARRVETPEAAMALLQENVVPVLAGPGGSLYLDFEAGRGGGRHPGQAESGHPGSPMPRWSSAWGRASLPGWTVTRWWRPCGATAWAG